MFERCDWLNEPETWSIEDGSLHVVTDEARDFWRETHYGFVRDNGHFLGFKTGGDFTAEVRVRGRYQELYDQAGLMVRVDAENWVKCGIELSDGAARLSSVLTVGRSDWATGLYADDPHDFSIRASVERGVLRLQVSADRTLWHLVRLAPFPSSATYLVGPFCCTPERGGLEVAFSQFKVTPPLGKDLHDQT